MTIATIVSSYFTLSAIFNYLFLMIGQFIGSIPSFILFGNSTHPSLWGFLFTTLWLISGWLVSTKFEKFQTPVWRRFWFWNMFIGITFRYLWLISAPVYNSIIPYLGDRVKNMQSESIWETIALGDTNTLFITIVFIPTIVTLGMLVWLSGQYSQYSADIKEAFKEFEFKSSRLQKYFKLEKTEHWPDVVLGPQSDTKELLVQPGRDRTLNNIIIGSIGTGKTAALVLPILNQDLHWMSLFINDYPKIYEREDFDTEEVKGMYLNGISVIEPSNDLCQKAYQLVKAHGIPEESVFYIDPTNPNTPSINPMQGPVDKIAESFALVIQGLAEGGGGGNFFFEQSERNHLKHYIYLLKLHEPEQEVTFDMLLNMYNNPNLVRVMHKQLKKTFPKNIDELEDRDERNHWAIVKQIDEWFDMNLLPKTSRVGASTVPEKVTHGEYRGEDAYYDAKAEYVQGLRNVLNDIGANPLIRRVLFGKSDFDFDRHLEMGGVLLVNTAKGEMAGLSNILGKLILLSLQNAVFRRKPNISTFHHILVDEFPDFIYEPFKEFPAQSRKYKTIVTVVAQTVAQLANKYGEHYMHTLLGTLRHKLVYGDIPDFDAQLFSKIFGEKERFEEGISEQSVSPTQEKPMLRMGNSYQKTKEAILSPSDIIYQKPFQCAVKIVAKNKPIPVKQIDANFVPKEEFEEATVKVDQESAKIWLENRSKLDSKVPLVTEGIEEDVENDLPPMDTQTETQTEEESEQIESYPEVEQPIVFPFIDSPEASIRLRKHTANTLEEQSETILRSTIQENSTHLSNVTEVSKPVVEEGNPLPNEKVTLEKSEENSGDSASVEIEEFTFEKLLRPHSSSVVEESKPELSELGEKQNQLVSEVMGELEKVPSPSSAKPFAFVSDFEE
jgi:hypothetical protein